MSFRFSLETVLRFRAEIERGEERKLQACKEMLARLESQLVTIKDQRSRIILEQDSQLFGGTLGTELHHIADLITQADASQRQLQREISLAEAELNKQMNVFLVARQNREILDELRTGQRERYGYEQEVREQMLIDELFNARRHMEK